MLKSTTILNDLNRNPKKKKYFPLDIAMWFESNTIYEIVKLCHAVFVISGEKKNSTYFTSF